MDMHVIFYPSGYLQLQIADDGDDFCHVYENPAALAKDVSSLMDGDNAIGWYGNDPDAWLDFEKPKGARFVSMEELPSRLESFGKGETAGLWDHEKDFYKALLEKRSAP